MESNVKISSAIAAVLGGTGASLPDISTAVDANSAATGELQEITVTAQRRAENIQDVPITTQALTGETIAQLNIQTFDDFIKYLPNVTQASAGPAQSEIFIRGLSVGANGGPGGGTTNAFPGVAIYLDEQSCQLPGRNLDLYAADLERIEVLEGPQGTLFGGGAELGVLRYITNRPKLEVREASLDAGYGTTAHGDANRNITAVINLPLISGRLAIRGVVYNDHQGGYINNVPSTFSRSSSDLGFALYNAGVVPTNSVSINNNNLVVNGINPLTYTGFRVEALYKFNEDWDVLLAQSYQNLDAEGVFYEMPYGTEGASLTPSGAPVGGQPLPPLSVNLFNPSYNKDKFKNTAWVVNGRVGSLKLIYSGSYLVRNVDQVQDYTSYARGVFASYYQCTGLSPESAVAGQCYTPSSIWREQETNTHQSHELRLSTPDDKRIRALVGAYWEDYTIVDQSQWTYVTVPLCSPTGLNINCFLPIQPWPGSPPFTPNPRSGFFDDAKRGYKQLAGYASLDVDLIPRTLTLTGGIRHFKYDNRETEGGDVGSFYCKQATPTTYFGPCLSPFGTNFGIVQPPNRTTQSGNIPRVSLSWHITDHHLLYYTWSQGFRPGTFNRSTSCHLPDANGVDQYCTPAVTVPDRVTNNEIGGKSEWFDHRLQLNASLYQEIWSNAQTSFFDPQGGLGSLVFNTNGPDYRVRGFEPSIVAHVTRGLTFQAAAAWNSVSQTNSPFLVGDNPLSVSYGKNITSIPNPYGPLGSPTAYSPAFKVSARVRYDWTLNDYNAHWQIGGQHQDHMVSETGYVLPYDMPGFSTYDASMGVAKGSWAAEIFGQNLTNVNASLHTSGGLFVLTKWPIRPRVLGIRVSYKFVDKRS